MRPGLVGQVNMKTRVCLTLLPLLPLLPLLLWARAGFPTTLSFKGCPPILPQQPTLAPSKTAHDPSDTIGSAPNNSASKGSTEVVGGDPTIDHCTTDGPASTASDLITGQSSASNTPIVGASTSNSLETGDGSGANIINVDSLDTQAAEVGEQFDSDAQGFAVPQNLGWLIDTNDFAEEERTAGDKIQGNKSNARSSRGDRIQKRFNQRRDFHVQTMTKTLYRLVDQINNKRDREPMHDEFISLELAATSATIDGLQFLIDRGTSYHKELFRVRREVRD